MSPLSALHHCKSFEHYTPPEYIDAIRYVLGRINLDPASRAEVNAFVGATSFYTAEQDGLKQPWHGYVYINPPGDKRGYLIKAFWRRACEHALYGGPHAAVLWAGYSLGPICRLLDCAPFDDGTPCPTPLSWPVVFIGASAPCTTGGGRIRWINGETGEPGKQPGHGNYFCLMGGNKEQRERFRERFGSFGELVTPSRLPRPRRNLEAEMLAIIASEHPRSKSAVARLVKARTSDVLKLLDDLVQRGRIELRADGWALVEVPNSRAPLTPDSTLSGTDYATERACI